MAPVEESEWLDPGESIRLGRRGRMVMQAMGLREFIDEVTEYEPGRKVAHRSESDSMVIRTACIDRFSLNLTMRSIKKSAGLCSPAMINFRS